ncbi:MAG: haloacid dehalogenase type II [Betaproteobacteria bacterium]|jgi:2-haloacid dehalogenase
MFLSRRQFLSMIAATAIASTARPVAAARAQVAAPYKAVVFDAFPIFDPRPVAKLAEGLFPGAGANLMNVWRTRQFEYQWWRAMSDQYVDFRQATEDSLAFAAKQAGLGLTNRARDELMGAYANLTVWPDAAASLHALHDAGMRLGFLSNMTRKMLDTGLAHANLAGLFEHVLSTDQIRTYKPAPAAYQMAPDAFGLRPEDILFVPFAGWDVAGAKWFGYPTFWVNRLGSPGEELGVVPDGMGRDLAALSAYVFSGARSERKSHGGQGTRTA